MLHSLSIFYTNNKYKHFADPMFVLLLPAIDDQSGNWIFEVIRSSLL